MSLFISIRRTIVAGIIAACAVGAGIRLYAQQSGGLTPPPRPAAPQSSAKEASLEPAPGQPFPVGEHLVYNVQWSSFPLSARLELDVSERGQFFGQDSYQVSARIETLDQVRSLFGEIFDQYTSYISTKSGIPYRTAVSTRHGQNLVDEAVVFDYAAQQAVFSDESAIAVPPGTLDLTSMIYSLRMRPIFDEGRQKYTALFGRELVEIEAEVRNRERISTQNGTYNTVCVRFYPQKKLGKYRASIWFTDDARRIPVLMTAKLSFGEVRAELTSATVQVKPLSSLPAVKGPTDESGNPQPGINGGGRGRVLPFGVGERLNYDISWGNFASVGRASFEVRQQGMMGNNRVFEFYAEAASTGIARSVINVNDQVSTIALADSLIPIKTDLRLREGKRQKLVTTFYDPAKRLATLSSGGNVALQSYTFDLVSLFFAVRALELKPGNPTAFYFLDANNRLQSLTLRVSGTETIGSPIGNREAVKLDVLTPASGLVAQAWISNDSRRLPLYFSTRTRFGEFRFLLNNAPNTR